MWSLVRKPVQLLYIAVDKPEVLTITNHPQTSFQEEDVMCGC